MSPIVPLSPIPPPYRGGGESGESPGFPFGEVWGRMGKHKTGVDKRSIDCLSIGWKLILFPGQRLTLEQLKRLAPTASESRQRGTHGRLTGSTSTGGTGAELDYCPIGCDPDGALCGFWVRLAGRLWGSESRSERRTQNPLCDSEKRQKRLCRALRGSAGS